MGVSLGPPPEFLPARPFSGQGLLGGLHGTCSRGRALVLSLSFETVRVPQRESDWPQASQSICVRAWVKTGSLLPTPGGHSQCVVLRTLLSWYPLCSLKESSMARISAAENMTSAHRTSRLSSTTMASETTDSTPSPTATVMPGWQGRGAAGAGVGYSYPVPRGRD